jgi:Anti-sigma factor NepR
VSHPEMRSKVARLPGIATQLIGERMRAMYASMTSEPVPDDLLDLVRKLEIKEQAE